MLISEIIPYERNARHNERAIPKVAESIKEFAKIGVNITFESRSKKSKKLVTQKIGQY